MEVRKPHVERERRERCAYLEIMSRWRQQRHDEEDMVRQQRIAAAQHSVMSNDAPPALLSPSAETFQAPPMGESLMLTANFSRRFDIPFDQTYDNPSLPSFTVPWCNGMNAGYFHMFASASAAHVPNGVPSPWTTSFTVDTPFPWLPRPHQLPQAPFEAANSLREADQTHAIPALPFGK